MQLQLGVDDYEHDEQDLYLDEFAQAAHNQQQAHM